MKECLYDFHIIRDREVLILAKLEIVVDDRRSLRRFLLLLQKTILRWGWILAHLLHFHPSPYMVSISVVYALVDWKFATRDLLCVFFELLEFILIHLVPKLISEKIDYLLILTHLNELLGTEYLPQRPIFEYIIEEHGRVPAFVSRINGLLILQALPLSAVVSLL